MNEASFEITEFKAVEGADQPAGLFAALVSVFGNVDKHGDRVMPGAFTGSLEEKRAAGHSIPVVFSHDHKDPSAFIGSVDPIDVKETERGLVVAGKLDVEDNPKAKQVFSLLKRGAVRQWSFAYGVKRERMAKDHARELLEVDLFEVGPTLVGANPETMTLALKEDGLPPLDEIDAALKLDPAVASAIAEFDEQMDALIEQKVGRALSAKTEAKVRAALAALEDVLSRLGEEVAVADEAAADPDEKSGDEIDETPTSGETAALQRQLTEAGVFLAERR